MNIGIFLVINFIVAFISDIFLRILSINYNIITSLKPYFRSISITESCLYASIIIEIALIITIFFSKFINGFMIPNNNIELISFSFLAFIIGYVIDILIYKTRLFSNLDLYYKENGAGFWGSMAFVFSILISYSIIQILIPLFSLRELIPRVNLLQ